MLITSASDLTLETYRRVALNSENLSVSDELLAAVVDWRAEFVDVLQNTYAAGPIYGVNVGAGDGSFQGLNHSERGNYQTGLNSATSFGEPLPQRVVRGIVLARLASFLDGTSAVTPALVEHLCSMLNEGALPKVPSQGNGGSGEILPLGHLFAAVPRAIPLQPKESMSLVNGAPCAGALAADVAVRSRAAQHAIELTMGLACHALNAPGAHFDPVLGELWGNSFERQALERLTELLNGPFERDQHQARVSVRILPRVLAANYEVTTAMVSAAAVALRHPGDNPVFVRHGIDCGPARILSNGSFHNHRPIVAIDAVARSFADLTQLGQHLIHAIYQNKSVLPNQDNLALGISYMVAGAWSEDARLHAAPSLLSLAAVGQNDVPTPTFTAWRKYNVIEEGLFAQLAILNALASQALYSTGRSPSPALEQHLQLVRDAVPPVNQRRDVGTEIGRLKEHLMTQQERRCSQQELTESAV